jgi:alkylhydroperoxidase/carboxymuconolactone decarboxylase family protein YurZ
MEKFSYRMLTIGLFVWSGLFSNVAATDPPQQSTSPTPAVLSALAQISAAGVAAQYDKAEQCFITGKAAGLSELQMYEAVLNLVPYTGYPRTLNTMSRFQKVYPQYLQNRAGGKEPQPTEPWQQYAATVWVERSTPIRQQLGVGGPDAEALTKQIAQLSPELAEWAAYDAFGRIYGRSGLSLLEREAVVMGALIAQGAPQIAVHYKALLRVGGNDTLVEALFAAVSGIVDEKSLTLARQYITEARKP